MLKKKKILFSLLVILTISTCVISKNISDKGFKEIFRGYAKSNKYLAANEITSLDIPTNITWKDDSTATAKWNSVTNANYYNVNVYVYNNSVLIGTEKTGTASNELDVQQEIYKILDNNNYSSYQVAFDVTAVYMEDGNIIESEISKISSLLYVTPKGTQKYGTPTSINLDDNYYASWSAISGADYYQVYVYINYNGKTYSTWELVPSREGSTSNGIFRYYLKSKIDYLYKESGFNGEDVNVYFKVRATPSVNNNNYKDGDYSISSNQESYYNSLIIKYDTPTSINLDDNYYASWSAISSVDYYQVYVYINYNGKTYSTWELVAPREGSTSNGIFRYYLKSKIDYLYRTYELNGENVNVYFKVRAISSTNNNRYSDGDYSTNSNFVSYYRNDILKFETPTNIKLDGNCYGSWSANNKMASLDFYQIYYYIVYNGKTYSTWDLIYKREGSTNEGTYKYYMREKFSYLYKNYVTSGETVQMYFKVRAQPSTNNTSYSNSDYSIVSNISYFNPNGSTVINEINLSPNKPVIAVGRSLYIGKTITPETAYYSTIEWKSSNSNIVSISNMGQITGRKKGTATITAEINNATQTAEVNVYEIESNITESKEADNVMNEANNVIEAVVADGDISNTDITNKDSVLAEIENGAKSGDKFNVDVKYDDKDKNDYDSIKSNIDSKYSGFKIFGGKDIKIEISHTDSRGTYHHIANITELENEVSLKFDINSIIPQLDSTKTREYKVIRIHNDDIEEIDFDIKNGIVETSSNKFSDFVLLYADTDVPVTGITVNKDETTINAGETETITVNILPENAANNKYTSTSSNEEIVTVDNNVISAVKPGKATVIFKSEDGNFTKTITVNVKAPLKNITLNKTSNTLDVIETDTLTVTYNPSDTTDDKTVTWTSSDEKVATVNNGIVTAVNPGKATITAKVGDKTATYSLTVVSHLKNIKFKESRGIFNDNNTHQLEVIYEPLNTTDDKTVTWKSSDTNVATVSDTGLITTKNKGKTIITAIVGDKQITYEVEVIYPVYIVLNKTSGTKKIGETEVLTVNYYRAEQINSADVTWTSSDEKIATVNNGIVTAINYGETSITARYNDFVAEYLIKVEDPLQSIKLTSNTTDVYVNDNAKLSVAFTPLNPSGNLDVEWILSDNSYGFVDNNNELLFQKKGTVTVTAKIGNITDSITFNVKQIDISDGIVLIDKNDYTYSGNSIEPNVRVLLNDSEIDSKYFNVQYNNNISPGRATITVSGNGKYSGTLIKNFNIIRHLSSISMNKSSVSIDKGKTDTLTVTYNPSDTTDDKTVIWTSSDSNIVKVENGKITAINYGKATITAKVGDKTATCVVEVKTYPLIGINLNKSSSSIVKGQQETLTVTYNPTNTTNNKTVTWSSSNNNVVKVENGIITGINIGTATITAKAGDKTATCVVEVKDTTNLAKIITNSGFKIMNNFARGFNLGDTIESLKAKFGNQVTINAQSKKIGTGTQLSYNGETATVVVYGDLNGDGDIDSADLLKMRQHLLGTSTLSGPYKEAGAVVHSNTIDSADLLRMRQYLLGTNKIEQ